MADIFENEHQKDIFESEINYKLATSGSKLIIQGYQTKSVRILVFVF